MERPQPKLGTQNETTSDRVLAWLGDRVAIIVGILAIATILGDTGLPGVGELMFGLVFFGPLVYHIVFEATYGQTPGKRLRNIVVVKKDGSPCDWRAAIIRNVLRLIDFLMFYLVGLVVILLSDDNQRIGDIGAGTVVTKVGPTTEPAGFAIQIHGDRDRRTIELVNETDSTIDLSGARLLHDSEERFRFQLTNTPHQPGQSMSELLNQDFGVEPGSPLTLEVAAGDKKGEQYEVRWA